MLSRTADSLYWLSRYVERAENLARVLDVASRLAGLPSAYAGTSNEWQAALATAACEADFAEHHEEATRESVVAFVVGSPHNPSSIRACIESARANARAVRTALTAEMWDVVNDAWLHLRAQRLEAIAGGDLNRFLAFVKEASLRFDGAATRTMLRNDAHWFQRLGTLVERADNTARLIDVKYHVLLPDAEPIGGGLDYFQWSSVLRAVSALTSYHWYYRQNVRPWLVADFLILRPEQPRSLVATYGDIVDVLGRLTDAYGRQGEAQRLARTTLLRLQNQRIEDVFGSGLHEFVEGFVDDNNRLGDAIAAQYLR